MTQKKAILDYIERFGSITTYEAFADLGITKLTTRISELRKDGYTFHREIEQRKTRLGSTATFMRYSNAQQVSQQENRG